MQHVYEHSCNVNVKHRATSCKQALPLAPDIPHVIPAASSMTPNHRQQKKSDFFCDVVTPYNMEQVPARSSRTNWASLNAESLPLRAEPAKSSTGMHRISTRLQQVTRVCSPSSTAASGTSHASNTLHMAGSPAALCTSCSKQQLGRASLQTAAKLQVRSSLRIASPSLPIR